ncbi:MAG: hypothetical protein PHF80_02990, partial [Methanothrix sp.]|nr:hypothetical protein [Methanothrix sp.]
MKAALKPAISSIAYLQYFHDFHKNAGGCDIPSQQAISHQVISQADMLDELFRALIGALAVSFVSGVLLSRS